MAEHETDPSRKRASRDRGVAWSVFPRSVAWSVVALGALAACWTGLWSLAAWTVRTRLDDWMKQEAGRGRAWTCPSARVVGFPFGLGLACDDPSFSGPVQGLFLRFRAAGLSARAVLTEPGRIEVEFAAPLSLTSGGGELWASFSSMRLELFVSLERLRTGRLSGEGLDLAWSDPERAISGTARSVEITATPVENAQATLDFVVGADGLAFPDLDAFTQSSDPARLSATFRLSGVVRSKARRPAEALEEWRIAGGRILLRTLQVDKGPMRLTASADLGLDAAHRLSGRAEVGETGANALLLRLGAPPAALGAANLLGRLLQGSRSDRPEIELPLVFEDGKLAIGPLEVASLDPLY
jgi:hypothetical protein